VDSSPARRDRKEFNFMTATSTGLPALSDAVTAAQLSDSLDAIGVRDQVLDGSIRPLVPGYRIAGPARTIAFEPVTEATEVAYAEPNPYDEFIAFMDGVQPGDVIVVATGGDGRTAYWGELFSAAAIGRGAAGVICDSYTRDRAKVAALGFPLFSTGTRPIDFRARMRVAAIQAPVMLGGVRVGPDDLLLAEDDGIVAVPARVIGQATELANTRAATESTVLQELLAGHTIGDVWRRHGVL
jgi:4-hydroxy-4-methyl-2-oxoglutarate aldolase